MNMSINTTYAIVNANHCRNSSTCRSPEWRNHQTKENESAYKLPLLKYLLHTQVHTMTNNNPFFASSCHAQNTFARKRWAHVLSFVHSGCGVEQWARTERQWLQAATARHYTHTYNSKVRSTYTCGTRTRRCVQKNRKEKAATVDSGHARISFYS